MQPRVAALLSVDEADVGERDEFFERLFERHVAEREGVRRLLSLHREGEAG